MAKSGKKGKKADNNKPKNKKGKGQETPEAPTPQPEPSTPEQEEQQVPEVTPVPDTVPDLTADLAPEPGPQSSPESSSGLESAPEPESELEQSQTLVEPSSTLTETELSLESSKENEDIFTQVTSPGTPTSEQTGFSYVHPETSHEPSQEDLSASDKFYNVGAPHDHNDDLDRQSGTVDAPEPTPVTAPQSPFFPSSQETSAGAWTAWDEEHQPEAQSTSQVIEPEPEPTTEVKPEIEPETELELELQEPLVQEVTPPASKPQSPEPRTISPSLKSASPIPRAASPTTMPHGGSPMTSPIPPPAAPTPPLASPSSYGYSPVKEPGFAVPKAGPPTPPGASPIYHAAYPIDQSYSPRQKIVSPLQKYASPVRKASSPLPKVSSPLAHPYASPVMAPHSMPMPPPMAPSMPPSIAGGYATAYQSPVMSSPAYMPQYAYYQPSPQMHPNSRGSMGPPHSGGSFAGLRDLAYMNGHGHEHLHNGKGGPMGPLEHEEPIELLQRIQDAIPDINRLLGSYKNTKTKLQSREAEFKQMESQHKQALMHKDFFVEALQSQLRKAANESAEEAKRLKNMINELRMELGNLEEKRKDFEEKLTESEASVKKLEQTKDELENQIQEEREAHSEALEKQRAEKEIEKEEALAAQKHELTGFFEEIKAEDEKAAADALAAREAELTEEKEVMRADYEQQKQQMQESHDALQADFDSKLAELASTKEELEQKHQELEDTRTQHAQELEELHQTHADKVAGMEAAFSEKEQHWNEEKTGLETQLSEKSEELANSERENKRLSEDVIAKEKQLEHSVDSMRLTIDDLDKDCDRLRKTLHSLGEATDLKSTKGDSFFLDCFGQLSRLIVTLSKDHFSYLPIDPPKEILSKLPPELPSFLDNTPASRELRSAYVQHVVSKTLTYRIFHPFLFTLGRRYDKADILFQMLSMDIRRKSVRREAFWRQQTLKAAYTTSDAKESINVVAAVIVDEISNHLKHFADPKQIDSLLTGIRKIVKLAAETWRHARVERELILASLPAPEANGVSNEDWDEYGATRDGSVSPPGGDPARHVVLRPFPRIIREAAHEDFVGDEEKANPCTYSCGKVLYSDSPIIIARLQELAKKSTDALANGDDSPRRGSRASNRYEPASPQRSKEELHDGNLFTAGEDAFFRRSGDDNCATA
ncbi:hypothetical protein P175DRAFT_0429647 [Aspergillus ochraceoroseus IBT 24754]|uniref:RNA polymerase Rpb1 C-terminal repeat domain-containing protein n=1 Tax=Aspergillus ochraceoroseus IBT 24754 TaxID=1392256 RepID=A0A2T5M5K2_9EURO|nr:uncharacterized protein P175DRAFT_0429647 [Aspergillus ochraceoroseus IBT 24754]PTU23817.1 hypothetical protein P175DRAFT_0429647 [Aspergillus ochraceoroseus IBT 24754]